MGIYREKGGTDGPSPLKKELGWDGGEIYWTISNKASFVIDYVFITLPQRRDRSSFHLILTFLSIKIKAEAVSSPDLH